MAYLGDSPEIYKNVTAPLFGLKLKTYSQKSGKDESWNDLADFFSLLNKTTDKDFEETIKNAFDVDMYLRGLVVEKMTINRDSYSGNGM